MAARNPWPPGSTRWHQWEWAAELKRRRKARAMEKAMSKSGPGEGHNSGATGVAADRLRSLIERWERLQQEIDELKADQKDIMAEAKGSGFDTRTMREIIKLRKMSQEERDEREALLDLYKAALGMLNGTPLGDAAIRRLTRRDEPQRPANDPQQTDIEDAVAKTDDAKPAPEVEIDPGPTVEEARRMGGEAAAAGKPVTDNPFPARDPRRAAWDEEWCRVSGSDGMDLPAAWKRSSTKKPPKPDDKKAA